MNSEIKLGQVWKHYKGNDYKIIAIGKHSESGEELIGYERVNDKAVYFRPKKMFLEEVEKDGVRQQRFALVSNSRVTRSIFIEAYGWYGAFGLLGAYALSSFNVLSPENIWYQIINITAAFGVVTLSFYKRAYQPGILNIVWAIVGLVAIIKLLI
jgi:hypothetical protein